MAGLPVDDADQLRHRYIDTNGFQHALQRSDGTNAALGHDDTDTKGQRGWATLGRGFTGHDVDPHKTTGSENRDGRIAGGGIVAKLPLSDKKFHKMIDSGGLRHHTSLPFNPKSIMSSSSITLLATRHVPATAGVMSCAALAHCAGLPRPVQVIAINSPISFGGADVFKPTRGYSWDLGTSYIREGRQMA